MLSSRVYRCCDESPTSGSPGRLRGVEDAREGAAVELCCTELALRVMGSAPGGTDTVRLKSSLPTDELLLPLFTSSAGSERPLACANLYAGGQVNRLT